MTVIDVAIAGLKHRPGSLDKLRATRGGRLVTLEREPGNRFDSNAVKVLIGGMHVGYIPRGDAIQVAAAMDAGQRVRATIHSFKRVRIDTDYKGRGKAPSRPRGAKGPKTDPTLDDEIGI